MNKSAPNTTKLAFKAFKTVVLVDPKLAIPYFIAKNVSALIIIYEIFVIGKLLDSIGTVLLNYQNFTFTDFWQTGIGNYFLLLVGIRAVISITEKIINHTETALYDLFVTESYEDIMRKISNLNLEDIEKKEVQTLISSVPAYSINATWTTFISSTELINNLLILISVGWVITTQISPLALGVIFFVFPEALYRYFKNRELKEYRDENARKKLYMDYVYQQATFINNFPELRVDNVFKFLIDSFDSNSSTYDRGQNKIRAERDKKAGILSFIDRIALRVVQLLLIPISISFNYTIGQFKYLFDYLEKLFVSSWHTIWRVLEIKENSFYIRDYFNLLEYKGFGDIVSGKQKLDTLDVPSIEFINVDFSYPDSKSATLENVSFRIEPGEKVAIVGGDDSGKSTIAKLLCGLYKIGPGDILINEISVRNLDRGELKDKVSVVFEDYVKYDFSIRKNISLSEPEREFRRRKFEEALEITGLDKWMRDNDIEEQQVLGKALGNGIQISSGHWQRIAIARALYRDRHILILDEALTQIDGPSREEILRNIIKHRPKQTFIFITQDKHHIELFDKIIHIQKGKITDIEQK